jgi:hydrogenase nickel incorporation protein HypB
MCDDCSCDHPEEVSIQRPGSPAHAHASGHGHRRLQVREGVLDRNAAQAARNRDFFKARQILALNLLSSPGSGKTTLLERTIRELRGEKAMTVIEGDQQTMLDAERIQAVGVPVVQVNTGAGCHLDADMVHRALHELTPPDHSLLFIENVGNLVCPALFDLGEAAKVVIISVTEGEDKPLKYPAMFAAADLCLINKIDLLPHVDFDPARCREYALRANHRLEVLALSARSGEGMAAWLEWLRQRA